MTRAIGDLDLMEYAGFHGKQGDNLMGEELH